MKLETMMLQVDVDTTAISLKLKNAADGQAVRDGLIMARMHVKRVIAEYPAVSRRPQPFTSDRQRRGFFAKLKSGEIAVPYVRGSSPGSERLGLRWRLDSLHGGLTVSISNNASYAGLVHGAKTQTAYHAGTGWKTDEDVARSERDEVVRIVEQAISRGLT